MLDRFYNGYDFRKRILHDPIEFPHRYGNRRDREVSAFISSCLAYGKIESFKPVIEKILSGMGRSPYSFLLGFDVVRHRKFFTWKYRFNESGDIVCLLYVIHKLIEMHSSLERVFKKHYNREDPHVGRALAGFIGEVMAINTSSVYGRNLHPAGLRQFFPSPTGGSACKRITSSCAGWSGTRILISGYGKGFPKISL